MKGNGHFWPAYVDMMTVLLLVYLLISMIFQVLLIVAQQNVGVKLSERRQVEIRSVSQETKHNEMRMILDSNQNYLGAKNQKALISWLEKNREEITKNGVIIYAAVQDGSQIGVSLTLQYDRCLEIFRITQQHGIANDKVTINNSTVNIYQEDFAAIYIKPPVNEQIITRGETTRPQVNNSSSAQRQPGQQPAATGGL